MIKDYMLYAGLLWLLLGTFLVILKGRKKGINPVKPIDVILYKAPVIINLVIENGEDFDTSVFSTVWFRMKDLQNGSNQAKKSNHAMDQMKSYMENKQESSADPGIEINDWDEADGNDAREAHEKDRQSDEMTDDDFYDFTEHYK